MFSLLIASVSVEAGVTHDVLSSLLDTITGVELEAKEDVEAVLMPVDRRRTAGCATLSDGPLGRFCGYNDNYVLLGDWRTESCESQCSRHLAGREGCCMQKTNKAHCWAAVKTGPTADKVAVQPHSSNGFQAIMCNEDAADDICPSLDTSPLGQFCGYGAEVYLGDWRTVSCQDQCNEYLAGREGCCRQKTNKAHCWVRVGGDADGVKVQPHSSSGFQAVKCGAKQSTCPSLDLSPLGKFCGYNSVQVNLGDWRTESCQAQCQRYLAGRDGCCQQKTNKAHCWVSVGGAAENVKVSTHSSNGFQAVMCTGSEPKGICPSLDASTLGQFCGYGAEVYLGDWRTESCQAQCTRYLAGRGGCCRQKTNKAHCWVRVGGDAEGVKVQPHSSTGFQAVMC